MNSGLLRSVAAGAASGLRSFTGLALLAARTPAGSDRQPDRTLQRPWAQAAVGLPAVGELVTDKLPQTPSRLQPAGFGGRLACAVLCGLVISRRVEPVELTLIPPGEPAGLPTPVPVGPQLINAGVAVAAAALTTWLGARWRARASGWFGGDLVGAVIEDAAAVALAVVGSRD
jgi:uncharacterized membrane protein